MFQESEQLFISTPSYSPNPAAQQLRQNVMNYLERERPFTSYSPISPPLNQNRERETPPQLEERLNSTNTSRKTVNDKRRGSKTMYSYVRKYVQGPHRKIIRIQIFDGEELNGSKLCTCKAKICAQHIVNNIFTDDIYDCAKDMINKIQKKM